VIQRIIELAPERIVYVSCNPATQARDLKLLCSNGLYTITEAQPVDMFPHTEHIECVVGLRRTGN
jgi:23S rRNA (uracil1939-C5)-methyltransferase